MTRGRRIVAKVVFVLVVAAAFTIFQGPITRTSERMTHVTPSSAWDYFSSRNLNPASLLGWLLLVGVCVAAWALGTKATRNHDPDGG